jgi:hypothetical protein
VKLTYFGMPALISMDHLAGQSSSNIAVTASSTIVLLEAPCYERLSERADEAGSSRISGSWDN